ncbi:MAG: sulfatase-like hydrolase/transferase, partial [Holophagales bacterium]|nr:sulfatase-like hydrolase/transferase [Holophagales bacterium]
RIFDFAHAHNPLTLLSHASILTGLYPYQHGVRENAGFRLPEAIPTLAEELSRVGFVTAAFVSAYVLDSRFGLDRGFDHYGDRIERNTGTARFQVSERRGDRAVEEALRWWNGNETERRFLWLHLFDPHAPYAPPEPWASDYADRPYRGEVAAVDAFLGQLLGQLGEGEGGGSAATPWVIFTADHGESLGEHGEQTHGLFAYGATLRVPLLVAGPGVVPGRDARLARHIDILPTVLRAAGLEPPAGLPGRSLLLDPEAETTNYFEALSAHLNRGWAPLRGVMRGRTKYIDLPIPELYDLEADPHEQNNLASEQRRLLAEMRALLPTESRWPPDRGAISAEEAARLRSLGYVTDTAPSARRHGPDDDPKRLVELDARIQRFSELFATGRLAEAVSEARGLVAARPTMPVGHTQLAHGLLELGRVDEALAAMEDARRKGWASPSLLRQLGLTLAQVGRAGEAVEVLSPLAEADDLEARSALGLALSELGRLTEAESALRSVLDAVADDAEAHERMAVVALRQERPAEALEHARRAVELDPGRAHAWNSLGVALYMRGRSLEALEAWQRSVAEDPEQLDTLFNLGMRAAE